MSANLAHPQAAPSSDLHNAFLKYLPGRLEQISRRGRRFCAHGWDINGLWLLHDDAQRLSRAASRHGELEICQQLAELAGLLEPFQAGDHLPDDASTEAIVTALNALAPNIDAHRVFSTGVNPIIQVSSPGQLVIHRAEPAPAYYWRRWVADYGAGKASRVAPDKVRTAAESGPSDAGGTQPAAHADVPAQAPTISPATDAFLEQLEAEIENELAAQASAPAVTAPKPATSDGSDAAEFKLKVDKLAPRTAPITKVAPKGVVAEPARLAKAASARLYHLTNSGELSLELDQRLEALGYELEIIDDPDELIEVLQALAPDLVIVDASFHDKLEEIGAVIRQTRERAGTRLPWMALADEDSVPVRLVARRAGADALLTPPFDVPAVIGKIQEVLSAGSEAPYRVLIVEDDRSQAMFAESILRNAGMQGHVVENAFNVLQAMDEFKPDMVLMDLYMGDCDGTELTALIRERDEYVNTPIVFLSGESDVEKHYEALDAGGDDFLSKPIRPKHLISAVSNRIRRARAMQKRVSGVVEARDANSGLYLKSFLIERLAERLQAKDVADRPGGLLYLDVDGVQALRDKHGLSLVEQLLGEAGTLLASHLVKPDLASRFGDSSFLVFCPDRPDGSLESLAAEMRALLVSHSFRLAGQPLRLRASVGVSSFRFGFADTGSLISAAEHTAREARLLDRGVKRFEPPKRQANERAEALVSLIREALEGDGFELMYQPIVAVQGGAESQYQSLLRLRDHQGRLHAAGEIVPAAMRADLMADVDRWVINQALLTIQERSTPNVPVKLFVNQAAITLITHGHTEWLKGQLRAHHVPGKQLVLELTLPEIESCIDEIVQFCEGMLPTGVQFCLSRFESGAVGDAVLAKLPVSYVKLAPKYLAAGTAPAMRDELREVIDRAHMRSVEVVAQRVEDAQSAATLWLSGIDFIQGNLVQQATEDMSFDFKSAVL